MSGDHVSGWQDVQAEVLRKIRTREWQPGDQIPKESELAATFGVARATVNRALQSLADTGLLERRRRAGTRVAHLPAGHAKLRIPVVRQEVEALGQSYGYTLLDKTLALPPPDIAAFFGLSGAEKILRVIAVHLADEICYIHEDRWISPSAIPAALTAPFDQISANEWLVDNVPISTGEISFAASVADAQQARLFSCAKGAPLLTGQRKTWHGPLPVTYVQQCFHPGYRLAMQV